MEMGNHFTRVRSLPLATRWLTVSVSRRLFERALHRMRDVRLTVAFPDQRVIEVGDASVAGPTLRILTDDFFARLATGGKVGLGEAYTSREWEADDIPGVLEAFASNLDRMVPPVLRRLRTLVERRMRRPNSLRGADRNIAHHYDLSNAFFSLFLDPSMTYSSAVFAEGDTLEEAQYRKYQAIAELAAVTAHDHVLEIGTGWGSMAIFLATTYGCHVTTATLSREQHALAVQRISDAGLTDRITVLMQDYRTLTGTYSKIVSIEMFEAVGEEYWPAFFAKCDALLAPGGIMAMQTITMPESGRREARRTQSWIQKHIFPGGSLPSLEILGEVLPQSSSLRVTATREIGSDYVQTLRLWRGRFLDRVDAVYSLGFTERFIRTWEFYLSFCEAGFATKLTGTAQLRLERAAVADQMR
jgi:cyclopropane-fatty-acyl-phospholipid synthase